MSGDGTSATFTRRGLMSASQPLSDISAWQRAHDERQ
jgi:hypothetical protein